MHAAPPRDPTSFDLQLGRLSVAPRDILLLAISAGWVVIGLIGHDPWKPDEAYTLGIVLDFLEHGDWVVPSLAGDPFVEKPPLFILAAAGFAHLFGHALPLHDAARLATGLFVGIALLFLALTGRELCGRGCGTMAVLVMIGCIGPTARLHQLITDVALLAGVAIGMYGLALARRSSLAGGIALGIGLAAAFLAKGLLGPGWLVLTALTLPVMPAWRTRGYFVALGFAAVVAVGPV
ncbi:MAG: glycosyltransferase family 39 protein, partial [Betaproteobacteria bacterium]